MNPEQPGSLPRVPELEGQYHLVRELGRGGTAVVYLARDRELGRDVAIKLIRPAYVQDEEAVARLVREARTVGKLQHPNIVQLLDTRRLADGGLALILQYVPGITLKERLRSEGALPVEDCRSILRDLGQALSYAHRSRIVHRDIKPENVYLDEELGLARLADFGIARAWDSDSGLTLPGTALGTPAYMSPEQVDGRDLDGRSDIYSLGLVGYELVTGQAPWEGESLYNIIYKQKHEELSPIRELRPDAPEPLCRAIQGAIRKDPEERWADPATFLRIMDGEPLPPGHFWGQEAAAAPTAPDQGAPGADPFQEEPPAIEAPARRRQIRRGGAALALLLVALLTVLWAMEPRGELTATARSLAPWGGEEWIQPDPSRFRDPPVPGVSAVGQGEAGVGEAGDGGEAEDSDAEPEVGMGPRLLAVFGDGQEGTPDSPLPDPLVLRLVDGTGETLGGVPVSFEVLSGGGEVDPPEGVTAQDGSVLARWTMGPEGSGEQLVTARVEAPDLQGVQGMEAPADGIPEALEVFFRATLGDSPGEDETGPEEEETPDPSSVNLSILPTAATGGGFTCRLSGSGEVSCWGGNDEGQLGDGMTARRPGPGPAVPGGPFARLATGVTHACALDSTGAAWCWGSNARGEAGGSGSRSIPAPVPGGHTFVQLSAGLAHTCGLTSGGLVYCWGANDAGQLGDGSRQSRNSPARLVAGGAFTSLVAGWRHSCALDGQGRAFCWGEGSQGQLGGGTGQDASSPRAVAGGHAFRALAAGNAHTCGIRSGDGAVLCWGSNQYGQLGTGTEGNALNPVLVEASGSFISVAAGGAHSCAVDSGGGALCWGRNVFGQLGDGTTQDRVRPVPVSGNLRFATIHSLGSHTCGRSPAGRILCWGYNLEGQLGDGTRQNRSTPMSVGGG